MFRAALLALVVAFLSAPRPACAAPSPSPAPSLSKAPIPAPPASPSPKPSPAKPDEWTEASRVFEQLSPDQKKKFLDNLDQWKSMSPEEQELYRDRELFRREKIATEIQDAIGKSGLHLDDDQREVYALRYTQERRKIEEYLHKQMEIKRQAMVADMLARLKTEFTATPTPAGTSPGAP